MALGNIVYTPAPALRQSDVVDNLLSTATNLPGSANQLRVLDEKLKNLSNMNLLVNGNLKDPVNQCGVTSWNGGLYGIDQWKAWNISAEVVSGGVKLSAGNNEVSTLIEQYVEMSESLEGENITFSVRANDKIYSCTGVFSKSENVIASNTSDDVYVDILCRNGCAVVRSWLPNQEETKSVVIESAKLELGSIVTPFVPPDPATELLKCQRYYYSNDIPGTEYMAGCSVGSIQDKTWINISTQFPTQMRRVPTVKINKVIKTTGEGGYLDSTKLIASNVSEKGFSCIKSEDGLFSTVLGTNYYVSYTADARIY